MCGRTKNKGKKKTSSKKIKSRIMRNEGREWMKGVVPV
jgi:hypothetical protein